MPITIVDQNFENASVKMELVISTIETNRERIRTIGNMIIATSGMLIPASLAFLLFFMEKGTGNLPVILLLVVSVILFLLSSILSILSSMLRQKIYISDLLKFVENLLILYNSELKISYYSFSFLIMGLVTMITSVLIFTFK